jgi:Flp pilus assembly protein TadD
LAAASRSQKALDLNPDQPLVLNYLGSFLVDKGSNLDEAFKMLRRAVDLRQRDGYIVDSLGWAYYRLGRYDDAVRELEKAIDLKPSDPVINDHLGDAYWRVGRKLEAHFQWNHARDLNPEPDELPKILDKINHGMSDKPTLAHDKAAQRRQVITPSPPPSQHDAPFFVAHWLHGEARVLTSTMSARRGSALISASVTGFFKAFTAFTSTMPNLPLSSVWSG